MKIEIYMNGKDEDEGEDDMPKKPSAFHKKSSSNVSQAKRSLKSKREGS